MTTRRNNSYRFADISVDAGEFRLSRGRTTLSLEPKAFDVLLFLIENRGRLVNKEELLDAVWKDSFVTPNVLTRAIAQIRKALGEDVAEPKYIETVPTRGYRFIAEVSNSHQASDVTNSVPAAHDEKTIAVLPFKLLDRDGKDVYLSIGLADSLITKLSNIRSLTVRPTSSVIRYAETTDAAAAGQELQVEAVLDGSVQQRNDTVRVSVRLIRTSDGKALWGNSFDAQFVNIFQLQDDISALIAEALKVQLSADEKEKLTRRPTDNIEAYQLYLRGKFDLYQFTPDSLQRAIGWFDRAVELDHNYALAYAGLAIAHGVRSSFGDDQAAQLSTEAAKKAVEIDPLLAETHAALAARYYWQDRDVMNAQSSFDRAVALDPNSSVVHHLFSWFLIATGRFDQAERHLRRALELDPLSVTINVDQGLPFFYSRRYSEAIARYSKALEIDHNFWVGHFLLSQAFEAVGDISRANEESQRASDLAHSEPTVKAQLARTLAIAGKMREADRLIREIAGEKGSGSSPYYIALAYTALNDSNRAFEYLEKALKERDKWIGWVKVDPRLDILRSDPRFDDFLRRFEFPRVG